MGYISIVGISDDRNIEAGDLRRAVAGSLRALGSDLDRFDEAVASRLQLHRSDLRCLEIAARKGPLSAGALAEQAGLSTSAITSVIDRAERAGYLRRTSDASDRRRVLVEVTTLGRGQGREAFAGLMEGTNRVVARYTAEELGLVLKFVEEIRAVVIAEADAANAAERPRDRTTRGDPR